MCVVNELKNSDRRVEIILKNGETYRSAWYVNNNQIKDVNGDPIRQEDIVYSNMLIEYNIRENDVKEWHVNRLRINDGINIYISDHAMDRLKQRNGWGRKTALRMVKKIYDNGLTPSEVKGKYAAWVKSKEAQALKHETLILYGDTLYIFSYNTLVTVLPAPKKGSYYNQAYKVS